MITSALILAITGLLALLVAVLPSGDTLPSSVASSFTWLMDASRPWDYILPMTTIWFQIALIIPVLVAYFFWNGVQWVINMVRGN